MSSYVSENVLIHYSCSKSNCFDRVARRGRRVVGAVVATVADKAVVVSAKLLVNGTIVKGTILQSGEAKKRFFDAGTRSSPI